MSEADRTTSEDVPGLSAGTSSASVCAPDAPTITPPPGSPPSIFVAIPTTGGPLRIVSLRPSEKTIILVEGDFRPLPQSAAFARLCETVRPLSQAVTGWELTIDGRIDDGESWNLPVVVAFDILARGYGLASDPRAADGAVFTTGAVLHSGDDSVVISPADYHLHRKWRLIEERWPGLAKRLDLIPPAPDREAFTTDRGSPGPHGERSRELDGTVTCMAVDDLFHVANALDRWLISGFTTSESARRSPNIGTATDRSSTLGDGVDQFGGPADADVVSDVEVGSIDGTFGSRRTLIVGFLVSIVLGSTMAYAVLDNIRVVYRGAWTEPLAGLPPKKEVEKPPPPPLVETTANRTAPFGHGSPANVRVSAFGSTSGKCSDLIYQSTIPKETPLTIIDDEVVVPADISDICGLYVFAPDYHVDMSTTGNTSKYKPLTLTEEDGFKFIFRQNTNLEHVTITLNRKKKDNTLYENTYNVKLNIKMQNDNNSYRLKQNEMKQK